FESNSTFETGQSEQSRMIVSLLPTGIGAIRPHRYPHIHFAGKLKSRGHDSQDCTRFPIETDGFIENSGLTAKSILPKRVADHSYRRGAGLVFVLAENPPEFRLRAQGRKHLCRHRRPREPDRLACASECKIFSTVNTKFFKGRLLILPIGEIGK